MLDDALPLMVTKPVVGKIPEQAVQALATNWSPGKTWQGRADKPRPLEQESLGEQASKAEAMPYNLCNSAEQVLKDC